jgi:hypothetical protein
MPLRRRFFAWLVTGPLGHFAAGMTDWIVMLTRYWWARARGDDPRNPSG